MICVNKDFLIIQLPITFEIVEFEWIKYPHTTLVARMKHNFPIGIMRKHNALLDAILYAAECIRETNSEI